MHIFKINFILDKIFFGLDHRKGFKFKHLQMKLQDFKYKTVMKCCDMTLFGL